MGEEIYLFLLQKIDAYGFISMLGSRYLVDTLRKNSAPVVAVVVLTFAAVLLFLSQGQFASLREGVQGGGGGSPNLTNTTTQPLSPPNYVLNPVNPNPPSIEIKNRTLTANQYSTSIVSLNVSSSGVGTFYIAIVDDGIHVLSPAQMEAWANPQLPVGIKITYALAPGSKAVIQQFPGFIVASNSDRIQLTVTITLSGITSGLHRLEIVAFELENGNSATGVTEPISLQVGV